jgi:hypothetical protein
MNGYEWVRIKLKNRTFILKTWEKIYLKKVSWEGGGGGGAGFVPIFSPGLHGGGNIRADAARELPSLVRHSNVLPQLRLHQVGLGALAARQGCFISVRRFLARSRSRSRTSKPEIFQIINIDFRLRSLTNTFP